MKRLFCAIIAIAFITPILSLNGYAQSRKNVNANYGVCSDGTKVANYPKDCPKGH
jgi:hypothetical protein